MWPRGTLPEATSSRSRCCFNLRRSYNYSWFGSFLFPICNILATKSKTSKVVQSYSCPVSNVRLIRWQDQHSVTSRSLPRWARTSRSGHRGSTSCHSVRSTQSDCYAHSKQIRIEKQADDAVPNPVFLIKRSARQCRVRGHCRIIALLGGIIASEMLYCTKRYVSTPCHLLPAVIQERIIPLAYASMPRSMAEDCNEHAS